MKGPTKIGAISPLRSTRSECLAVDSSGAAGLLRPNDKRCSEQHQPSSFRRTLYLLPLSPAQGVTCTHPCYVTGCIWQAKPGVKAIEQAVAVCQALKVTTQNPERLEHPSADRLARLAVAYLLAPLPTYLPEQRFQQAPTHEGADLWTMQCPVEGVFLRTQHQASSKKLIRQQ